MQWLWSDCGQCLVTVRSVQVMQLWHVSVLWSWHMFQCCDHGMCFSVVIMACVSVVWSWHLFQCCDHGVCFSVVIMACVSVL